MRRLARIVLPLAVAMGIALRPCHAQPESRGRWSAPFDMQSVAIHATLLRDAQDHWRYTWWSGFDGLYLHDWDYSPGPFDSTASFLSKSLAPTPDNFYECGFTPIADGRMVSLGGLASYHNDGTTRAKIYDPVAHQVTTCAPIGVERFEPSLTALPDGRVLVSGGIRWVYGIGFGGRAPRPGLPGEREARPGLLRLALHPVPAWQDSTQDGWGSSRRAPALEQHTALFDVGGFARMLVFGGHDPTRPGGQDFVNDHVWQLERFDDDPTREVVWTWDSVTTTADPSAGRPDGRWAHAAVITGDRRMVVFGGRTVAGALGDVWQLQLAVPLGAPAVWKRLAPVPDPAAGAPSARWGCAAVYDAAANRMVLFGGRDAAGLAADDCWELSLGTTPAWHVLAPSGQPREGHSAVFAGISYPRAWIFGGRGTSGVRGDLMEYRLDTGTWRTPVPAPGSPLPPARADHAACFGGDDQDMIVSGGELADGSLDDRVWRLKFVAPFFESTQLQWVQDPVTANGPGPLAGQTLLPEDILVTSRRFEIYDPLASTDGVPGATQELAASAKHFVYFYPAMMVLPGGHVLHASGSISAVLDLASQAWTTVPGATQGGTAGQSVQYAPGHVLRCGGNSRPGVTDVLAFDAADHTAGWTAWTLGALQPRILHRATLLPTGDVLVTGGFRDVSDPVGVRNPQLWNAASGWSDSTALAPEPLPRGYHSTAMLLPDGRVLTAGGSTFDVSPYQGCVYEPPCLFDANGALARQTQITQVPPAAGYGSVFTVGTAVTADAGTITGACLMRPCALTHDPNFEQRRVPLAITPIGDSLRVTLPASANLAPPGDYMLFLLRDASGRTVPSIARWIRIGAGLPVLATPPAPWVPISFERPAPNPARGTVRLRFTLPFASRVQLAVTDVAGRQVRSYALDGRAGSQGIEWDRRDDGGHELAPGLYFARLRVAGRVLAWPVVLVR